MKITILPINRDGKNYMFEPYTGFLLERIHDHKSEVKTNFDAKVSLALNLNNHPYLLQKPSEYQVSSVPVPKITTRLYVKFLIGICKMSFLLSRILTIFRFSIFENSTEAIIAFRKILPATIQSDLCLPRALFAAITSKKFTRKGVVFIGISLPSKTMHAWVIEDGVQPDSCDKMWINFQPVAAIW